MPFVSPKMSLRIWNLVQDQFDHDQLADNWMRVDQHDHTPGRGVQIPGEGIADGSITAVKLAPSAYFIPDASIPLTKLSPAQIIRGSISSAGALVVGSGFTPARTGVGVYTVTFDTAFAATPVPIGTGSSLANTLVRATSTTTVATFTTTVAGAATDAGFNFIVIAA